MNRLAKFAITTLTLLTLGGCGDFSAVMTETGAVAAEVGTTLGAKPMIGFNINNGTVTQITATFEGAVVSKHTVNDLERHVRAAVKKHMKASPQNIYINVHFSGKAIAI